jgi:hypothetical protein
MTPHWKIGRDFAIRYGGRGNIQWFGRTESPVAERGSLPRGGSHAYLVLQAVETAAAVAQWWEARKQTAIVAAEFEERRLIWCADLLATLASEVSEQSVLHLDTTRLLEREIRRTMAILHKNSKMDVPYSFVLQCERTARGLISLNHLMYSELRRASPYGGDVSVPEYVPYDLIRELPPGRAEKSGLVETIRRLLPSIFGSGEDALSDWMKNAKKDPNLVPIENLALELRSAELHLAALERLPETVREIAPDEEVVPLPGFAKLAAALGMPLALGAG